MRSKNPRHEERVVTANGNTQYEMQSAQQGLGFHAQRGSWSAPSRRNGWRRTSKFFDWHYQQLADLTSYSSSEISNSKRFTPCVLAAGKGR
jgi:hypothetical protein